MNCRVARPRVSEVRSPVSHSRSNQLAMKSLKGTALATKRKEEEERKRREEREERREKEREEKERERREKSDLAAAKAARGESFFTADTKTLADAFRRSRGPNPTVPRRRRRLT